MLASRPFQPPRARAMLSPMAEDPEIIGGPTLILAPRPGETYRWKVQHGPAEKHVYVQIADSLSPEDFEDQIGRAHV